MPGKQVRINKKLHRELEAQADGTIGQHIERLVGRLREYEAYLDEYGIDPDSNDRIIKLSESAWEKLNITRAQYIMEDPSSDGSMNETIIRLLSERNNHEPDRHVATGPV